MIYLVKSVGADDAWLVNATSMKDAKETMFAWLEGSASGFDDDDEINEFIENDLDFKDIGSFELNVLEFQL